MNQPPASVPAGVVPEATDLRRAAAMLIAADPMAFNLDAVAEIIGQVKNDLRITELVTGMAVLAYRTPDLGTAEGQHALWAAYANYLQVEKNRKEGDENG